MSELLMAVLIMSLMTLVLTSGINASTRVYNDAVTYSEKRVLLSTLSEAVMAEIRNGTDFQKVEGDDSGNQFTFTSKNYGSKVSFSVAQEDSAEKHCKKGQLLIGGNPVISSGSYSNEKITLTDLGAVPDPDIDPVNTAFKMSEDDNGKVSVEVCLVLQGGEFRRFTVSPMMEQ